MPPWVTFSDSLENTLLLLTIIGACAGLLRGSWVIYRKIDAVLRLTEETHHATTVNGHKSDPATLPDKLSTVIEQLEALAAEMGEQRGELRRLGDQAKKQREILAGAEEWRDEHAAWSTAEVHRIWSYILDAEKRGQL